MKTERPGTTKRISNRIRAHYELMTKYETEGMNRIDASKRAFNELFGKKKDKKDGGL